MTTKSKCRRCAGCIDAEHHWIEHCVEGDDFDYTCKHCGAVGKSCRECSGYGIDGRDDPCGDCDGYGVIEAGMRPMFFATKGK